MDILTRLSGFDELDISARLALAVQGTLLLFFVVSPLMGMLMARLFEKAADALLAFSAAMLVVCCVSFAFNWFAQSIIPPDRLPPWAVQALSFAFSGALAGLVMRYIRWYTRPPQDIWTLELEATPEEDLSIFDQRRLDWLARKKRAQRR